MSRPYADCWSLRFSGFTLSVSVIGISEIIFPVRNISQLPAEPRQFFASHREQVADFVISNCCAVEIREQVAPGRIPV